MILLFNGRTITVEKRVNITIDGVTVVLDNALEAPFTIPRSYPEPVRLSMASAKDAWFAANAIRSSLDCNARIMELRIVEGVLNAEEMW